jgi:hypothetical protein
MKKKKKIKCKLLQPEQFQVKPRGNEDGGNGRIQNPHRDENPARHFFNACT